MPVTYYNSDGAPASIYSSGVTYYYDSVPYYHIPPAPNPGIRYYCRQCGAEPAVYCYSAGDGQLFNHECREWDKITCPGFMIGPRKWNRGGATQ